MKKLKQILALLTIVVIVGLYIVTLVLALMNNAYTQRFFYASLFASIFIPVMLYLIFWIANVLRQYNPNNKETHEESKKQ